MDLREKIFEKHYQYFIEQNIIWPKFYPGLEGVIYSPKHYHSDIDEEYKRKINEKNKDNSDYFLNYLIKMFKEAKFNDKLKNLDLICAIPSSNGNIHPTIDSIGHFLEEFLQTRYENIIKIIRKSGKMTNSSDYVERFNKVNGAMQLKRRPYEREGRILLIDDQKTTGITFLEAIKTLKYGGAEEIFCMALANNYFNYDPKGELKKSRDRLFPSPKP